MKPLSLFLIGAALISGPLLGQTFEGKVTMVMKTSDSSGGPASINYTIKDGFTRMDASLGGRQSGIIFDLKNRQMIILMPERSMYMVQPLRDPGSGPQPPPGYGPPGAPESGPPPAQGNLGQSSGTETILGYTCTKYVYTAGGDSTEIWVTDQLGAFNGFGFGGPPGGRSSAPQGWSSALKGRNFFPLRVVGTENGRSFRMDVTAVEKTSIPDSTFAPPDGWQKFDMGSMMQGMGAGGFMPPQRD